MSWHEVAVGLRGRTFAWCTVVALFVSGGLGLMYVGLGLAMIDAGESVSPNSLLEAAMAKGSVGPIVAGVLGASTVGALFRHGGLATALWLTPRRRQFAGVTFGGLVLPGVLIGLLSGGVVTVLGALLAPGSPSVTRTVTLLGVHAAVCAAFCLSGGAIATLTGSKVVSVAMVIGWPLLFEPALRGGAGLGDVEVVSRIANLLPGALLERLHVSPANAIVSIDAGPAPLAAGLALTVFVGVLVGAACRRLETVDA